MYMYPFFILKHGKTCNCIDGVRNSMFNYGVVDCGLKPRSGQAKTTRLVSTASPKHEALQDKNKKMVCSESG
jgi:hypothetical protein